MALITMRSRVRWHKRAQHIATAAIILGGAHVSHAAEAERPDQTYFYLNNQSFRMITCEIRDRNLEEQILPMAEKVAASNADSVTMVKVLGAYRLIVTPAAGVQVNPPQLRLQWTGSDGEGTQVKRKSIELMNKSISSSVDASGKAIRDAFDFLWAPAKVESVQTEDGKGQGGFRYQRGGSVFIEKTEAGKRVISQRDMTWGIELRHQLEFVNRVGSRKPEKKLLKKIVTKNVSAPQLPDLITGYEYLFMSAETIFPSSIVTGYEGKKFQLQYKFENCSVF